MYIYIYTNIRYVSGVIFLDDCDDSSFFEHHSVGSFTQGCWMGTDGLLGVAGIIIMITMDHSLIPYVKRTLGMLIQ